MKEKKWPINFTIFCPAYLSMYKRHLELKNKTFVTHTVRKVPPQRLGTLADTAHTRCL